MDEIKINQFDLEQVVFAEEFFFFFLTKNVDQC